MSAMVRSENIVFEVCDNYQKQTLRNRTYIAHAQGTLGLFVPIKHNKTTGRQKTKEVQSESAFAWAANHWKSIQTAYRTAPFFEYYEDELADLFTSELIKLQDHNLKIIDRLMHLIGKEFNYGKTQAYQIDFSGKDWRYYGEQKRNSPINFPHYIQVFQSNHAFISNCSVLDALFNLGPQTLAYLEDIPLDQ
jgi:hypothetical protein